MADIEIKNLSFSYPLASNAALSDVSLFVESGRLCLVCGSSGSGKSTLLCLLKSEIAPHGKKTGEIFARGKIGFVGQDAESNIITDTVYGELAFGLQSTSLSRAEIALKIAETASYFTP
ncbi:MAG: ATP-binding cassette domain-containing protein [Anaerotruncus sp.]|nr:MAG: ATP-binding cassette domain-containing protein [Anaerotruncus sp.]